MDRFLVWRLDTAAVAALLCLLLSGASTVAAQELDPGAAVLAYSAALNGHDLESALALFDEYGSAADASGRHFEGRPGLTEFLLQSGFGDASASITTLGLHVVANRAVWTYGCSCAVGSTEVRLVLIHQKISVFAVMAPATTRVQRSSTGVVPWMVGIALTASAVAGGMHQFGSRRGRLGSVPPRRSQGRLMAALALYRPCAADSEREELPAAAMTSFNDSEDSAAPCSR